MKKRISILVALAISTFGFAQINPTNNCGVGVNTLPVNASCVVNNYTMAGSFSNSGINSGCGSNTNRDDGFYQFTTPAGVTDVTIEENSCTGSNDRRRVLAVYTGSCGTGLIACVQNVACTQNTLNLTGLTPSTTYYIQLDRTQGGGGATMTGTICIFQTPNADVAWPGLDLGTLSCTSTTNQLGNTTGATIHCGASSAGDHTYQFTTTEVTNITIDLCGSSYDTEAHLFLLSAGHCDGTPLVSNDDNCGVQSSFTVTCAAAGTYVVIIEGSGAAEGSYDMDVIINNCGCPVLPSNNLPCDAQELVADTVCNTVVGDNTLATDSGVTGPSCAAYGGQDVWYYAIVPASGEVTFQTYGVTGGLTDTGIATYSGANCGSLTQMSCNDDFGSFLYSKITESGQTPGDTIWCRVWDYGGNDEGQFQICAGESTCNGSITNDYCEDPAVLTQVPLSSFTATTSGVFTSDTPSNLNSVFCGSIENNSWYQFTASSISHTFPISNVFNCGSGGIQAEVYALNNSPCCNTFSSVSNCFNPGTVSTGTVTATGLTIGQSYLLMIDGFGGAGCDFTITGWSATNVLPVTLFEFYLDKNIDNNHLKWSTKSEADSRWFVIEKSYDGENFTEIGRIAAAGNSSTELQYEFIDEDFNHPFAYYRLQMVDIDLTTETSQTISVLREIDEISIYPNPTSGEITMNFTDKFTGNYVISYTDVLGRTVLEDIKLEGFQTTYTSSLLKDLPSGIYFLKIRDTYGNVIQTEPIVKK